MNLLVHILGMDDLSGRWYGFWSGFGSDIGELGIIGGLVGLLRHKNCHVKGCPYASAGTRSTAPSGWCAASITLNCRTRHQLPAT